MNYIKLSKELSGRCYNSRKLANNTYAVRRENYLAIKLHNTEILKFYPNGDIEINTGGWTTVTTKERLNRYLPAGYIYQEKYQWYFAINGKTINYKDRLVINNGKLVDQDRLKRMSVLDAAQTVHKFDRLFTMDEAQRNTNAKRYYTAAGLSFPSDWDSLPEDEKTRRLNGVMEIS